MTTGPQHAGVVTTCSDRTGVLVIRIWIEPAAPHEVRARITTSRDLTHGHDGVSAAGSVAEVEEVVSRWLRDFSAEAAVPAASSAAVR